MDYEQAEFQELNLAEYHMQCMRALLVRLAQKERPEEPMVGCWNTVTSMRSHNIMLSQIGSL